MKDKTTWKDVVRDALTALGGEGHLKEINKRVEGHPKCLTNPTWKDTIRRVVRQYKIFQPVPPEGSGVYRLALDSVGVVGPQNLAGGSETKHGIIQGMLTGLGNVYGYETFVPLTDQTIRHFQNKPLSKFVTLNNLELENVPPRIVSQMKRIDALWLTEGDTGLIPVYGFEVEETTRVKSGLDRLLKIPREYQAKCFVIGPSDEEKNLFTRYCSQPPFRPFSRRLQFRHYEDVSLLYDRAVEHGQARDQFGVVERWRQPF